MNEETGDREDKEAKKEEQESQEVRETGDDPDSRRPGTSTESRQKTFRSRITQTTFPPLIFALFISFFVVGVLAICLLSLLFSPPEDRCSI